MKAGSGIHHIDAIRGISQLPDESVTLLWTDPPFGTGRRQELLSRKGTSYGYQDIQSDEAIKQITDTIQAALPKLHDRATVAICLNYLIVHEVKVEVNRLLHFEQEIIHHFELGATKRSWWTNKHNTILLFSKGNPKFNSDQVPRVSRTIGTKKSETETRPVNSVWTITFGPMNPERTGWPGQKPVPLIEPFVLVHTDKNDLVIDPFAGSGSVGLAAKQHGRRYQLFDTSDDAISVMKQRGL